MPTAVKGRASAFDEKGVGVEQMRRVVAQTPIALTCWLLLAYALSRVVAPHVSTVVLVGWWVLVAFMIGARALPWVLNKAAASPASVYSNLAAWSIAVSASALGVLLCILPLSIWHMLTSVMQEHLRSCAVVFLVAGTLSLVTLPKAAYLWIVTVGTVIVVGPYLVEKQLMPWTTSLLAVVIVFLLIASHNIGNTFNALRRANSEADRQRSMVELLLHDFQEEAREWLWETNAKEHLVYVSPRAAEAVGRPVATMLGTSIVDVLMPEDVRNTIDNSAQTQNQRETLVRLLKRSTPFRNQIVEFNAGASARWFSLSAKPLFDGQGQLTGWRGTGIDVTSEFTRQREMERLATVDPLTGLANRARLNQELERHFPALAPAAPCALLLLDLDDFKDINDRHGHPTGDRLLQQLAVRLTQQLRAGQLIARLGGDEFALVVPGELPRASLAEMGERILAALATPYVVDDMPMVVRCSIGIALGGVDAQDAKSLLKSADLALYAAKAAGRNTVRFYGHDMHRKLENRFTLTEEMRRALAEGQFELQYQPFVASESGLVTGFEALLRWNHPTRGLLRPEQFVSVAEETSIIGEIGEWVFRQACAQARSWPRQLRVAVNVSAVQFSAIDVCIAIKSALQATALPPERLEVEITESTLFHDAHAARRSMISLREMGVLISLDDFGAGHASLNHMRTFPITRLKIDRAFVTTIADTTREGNESRAIVRAAIELARAMEMEATAEGVETLEQLQVLKRLYCDEVQGYFIAHPMSAAEIPAFLARNGHRAEPTAQTTDSVPALTA